MGTHSAFITELETERARLLAEKRRLDEALAAIDTLLAQPASGARDAVREPAAPPAPIADIELPRESTRPRRGRPRLPPAPPVPRSRKGSAGTSADPTVRRRVTAARAGHRPSQGLREAMLAVLEKQAKGLTSDELAQELANSGFTLGGSTVLKTRLSNELWRLRKDGLIDKLKNKRHRLKLARKPRA